MEVQAMQGYFDNGVFYQQGRRVKLPEHKMVIVNVLNIPVDVDETKKADKEFWKEFDRLAKASADEELMMADFPRVHFGREPISFDDGEQPL
jgi:hypothetical protein